MTAPPSGPGRPEPTGPVLFLLLLVLLGLIAVAWDAGYQTTPAGPGLPQAAAEPAGPPGPPAPAEPPVVEEPAAPAAPAEPAEKAGAEPVTTLPGGRTRVFEGRRFLVAHYGTAGTGALGVLGERPPERAAAAVRRTARAFRRPGRPVQPVFELIVTVADSQPGPDGDYSHDIERADVRRYIAAARRHGVLLLLDLQPGRSDFLTVAKRWEWALRDPYVGLALDPEWRMPSGQVPGRVVGRVHAREVNKTSAWLAGLVRRERLPEKLFVLHQFRTSMLPDIERIKNRPGLASVQHVDGFGNRREKRATYTAVAKPRQFTMGFKLFYDEDVNRMGPADVHAIRPRVRFVSFQ
ncbi:hypothetical protein [Nocardioides sp. W7]|uniref:hypothetical protein n=1 Tax=Nocardioides sp. W7 TaxID=2931390 RepID=UPI001FD55782|nr:hypothetical protein [Nocardioides sp. W7]